MDGNWSLELICGTWLATSLISFAVEGGKLSCAASKSQRWAWNRRCNCALDIYDFADSVSNDAGVFGKVASFTKLSTQPPRPKSHSKESQVDSMLEWMANHWRYRLSYLHWLYQEAWYFAHPNDYTPQIDLELYYVIVRVDMDVAIDS